MEGWSALFHQKEGVGEHLLIFLNKENGEKVAVNFFLYIFNLQRKHPIKLATRSRKRSCGVAES